MSYYWRAAGVRTPLGQTEWAPLWKMEDPCVLAGLGTSGQGVERVVDVLSLAWTWTSCPELLGAEPQSLARGSILVSWLPPDRLLQAGGREGVGRHGIPSFTEEGAGPSLVSGDTFSTRIWVPWAWSGNISGARQTTSVWLLAWEGPGNVS